MHAWIGMAACVALLPAFSYAAPQHAHGSHAHSAKVSASTVAYEKAMKKMHKHMAVTITGDADTDYVRGMIPHHQGAVDMARIELQYGRDPKMRKLARWIIISQEQEIAWMKQWLRTRGHVRTVNAQHASIAEMKAAEDAMHHAMHIKYTGDADVDFARGMIPHHQGAVDMSNVVRRHGKRQEINDLAWDITVAQQSEIDLMQAWLEQH